MNESFKCVRNWRLIARLSKDPTGSYKILEAVRTIRAQANAMGIKIYLCLALTGSNINLHMVKFIISSILILFSC